MYIVSIFTEDEMIDSLIRTYLNIEFLSVYMT